MPEQRKWTEEEDFTLATMWRAGASASQIAKVLENRTRNSVIGRIHRLDLPPRQEGTRKISYTGAIRLRREQRAARRAFFTPVAQPARIRAPVINPNKPKPREPADLVESLNVPFLELQAFQCKAVTDDTRFAQKFCGHFRATDSVYCAAHAALYAAPPQKERAA